MDPFDTIAIRNESRVKLGKGVSLEFCRVPHREQECGETYGIIIELMPRTTNETSPGNPTRFLFLPDHDSYSETLEFHQCNTIRELLKRLSIDVALLDGTFFTIEEVTVRREDATGIPHPPIEESLKLLGKRRNDDPDIVFIHFNHTNPVIDKKEKRHEIEELGWRVGLQGMVWER